MAVYRIVREQHIRASIDQVWKFFSDPGNLQRITPAYMRFRVTSGSLPDEIYPGQIITYKIAPLFGISLFWMTEITHVKHERMFIDEQRRGPYRMWHHEHHFTELEDGTVHMRDIVHYQLPLGILGRLAHWLFVEKQLEEIFEFRKNQIIQIFH
jgi:ligand-binding SRPBCC domain-containing protein